MPKLPTLRWARGLVGGGLGLLLMCGPLSCRTDEIDESAETAAITSVLREQEAAWNRGDIAAYMEGYWRSPELRFASGGHVQSGWEATATGYAARYPDKKAMGQLAFEIIEIRVFSPTNAMAFGKWQLHREQDKPAGLFTLILERKPQGWRVVHDHTSAGE